MKRKQTPKNNAMGESPQFYQKLERRVRDTPRGITTPNPEKKKQITTSSGHPSGRQRLHPQYVTTQM